MFTLTEVQSYAIAARIAMIVGAATFDRVFAGVEFSEVEGDILFVFARSEAAAAEIEDNYALHISIIASDILKQEIGIVMVMPRVLH
jgi:hypothetical protein